MMAKDIVLANRQLLADSGPLPARPKRFDGVTIGVHWMTALLVLAMFVSVWLRWQTADQATRAILLQIHRSMGMTIWVVSGMRLAWRFTNMRFPHFPANITKSQRLFVQSSEFCLYALLLGQPATGLAMMLLSGRPFAVFGVQFPAFWLADKQLWDIAREAHYLGAWAFGAVVLAHAVAGLVHHVVLHDDVLKNMAPVFAGKPRAGITPPQP